MDFKAASAARGVGRISRTDIVFYHSCLYLSSGFVNFVQKILFIYNEELFLVPMANIVSYPLLLFSVYYAKIVSKASNKTEVPMRAVKESAYAKINLHLDVISRRPDGFHDIKTVMHSVSLCDDVTVTASPSPVTSVRMSVKGSNFLPTDEKNLAVRAALLYLKSAGLTASVDIRLDKKIPVSAGLAGGSSDAAATLRAMNKLFDRIFSDKALYRMAAELGSDVPFCLYGKTALCEGRGEIITKLPDTLKLNVVIAIANERVSTPGAYAELDREFASFDGSVPTSGEEYYSALLATLKEGKIPEGNLFNIFEKPVLKNCPKASRIKQLFYELGARVALMSGSGPSVFGIFDDAKKAEAARSALSSQRISAYIAKSV